MPIGQQHPTEKSQELQRRIYLAAKRNKERRFHALYDRIYRLDILWRAWQEVKRNGGRNYFCMGNATKQLQALDRNVRLKLLRMAYKKRKWKKKGQKSKNCLANG